MTDERDICTVISFLRNEVIPSEELVHSKLEALYNHLVYLAPEVSRLRWHSLCSLLDDELGEPSGCDWKERVGRIISGNEKVKDDH